MIFFVGIRTSDFILQGRKPKFTIKLGTENILYPKINNNLYRMHLPQLVSNTRHYW
jgi:hypothetical protein